MGFKSTTNKGKYLDYFLLLSSWLIVWGAIIYYFYTLNAIGISLTILLAIASCYWLRKAFLSHEPLKTEETTKPATLLNRLILHKINIALIVIFLALTYSSFCRLYQAGSTKALISPWQVVSYDFFWLYALSALALSLILIRTRIKGGLKLTLISLYYFLSFSAAAIVYKIGYGYDPFIHQAAMEIIASKGAILPKTPYYLGEYSLIIIISKISGLTINFLNRFLVPFFAALFLPAALFNFLRRQFKSESAIYLIILFLLTLTFSPFIATTPQNLSYLFLVLAVLAAVSENLPRVIILSIASAAIHPLAGLPAIALSAYIILQKYGSRFSFGARKICKAAIWIFTALSIPAALFYSSGAGFKNIGGGRQLLTSILNLFGTPMSAGREDLVSNFIYLFANNYQTLIILALTGAMIFIYRSRLIPDSLRVVNRGLIFISSALFLAYLLSGQIIFNGIINYEQSGYANRIPVAILIFMLPSLATALFGVIKKILEEKFTIKIIWLVFGLCLLSVSFYISYPRFDKYFNSRGYSTGANDIAAVKSIEAEARTPYIVLANQQVSVAALKTFGFNHYYQTSAGELYFYPIPTGGPLYQYYLEMVYKNPGRESMNKALALAEVDLGYLVVNKYWYQSGQVINKAKLLADKWWTINNEVYIFKYER